MLSIRSLKSSDEKGVSGAYHYSFGADYEYATSYGCEESRVQSADKRISTVNGHPKPIGNQA